MDIMESVMAGIADAPNEFSPQPYEPERGKSVLRNAEDREGREYLQCTPMFAETSTLSSYSESQLLGASQQGRASKDVEAGRAASPSAGGGGSSKPPASTMKEADKSWREEMQRFWAEVGVVEPLTVETLLRLAAKYERINNTAKLRNRLVHLQVWIPKSPAPI